MKIEETSSVGCWWFQVLENNRISNIYNANEARVEALKMECHLQSHSVPENCMRSRQIHIHTTIKSTLSHSHSRSLPLTKPSEMEWAIAMMEKEQVEESQRQRRNHVQTNKQILTPNRAFDCFRRFGRLQYTRTHTHSVMCGAGGRMRSRAHHHYISLNQCVSSGRQIRVSRLC